MCVVCDCGQLDETVVDGEVHVDVEHLVARRVW